MRDMKGLMHALSSLTVLTQPDLILLWTKVLVAANGMLALFAKFLCNVVSGAGDRPYAR